MDTQLVYLLDSHEPISQNEQEPRNIEELADMIIGEAKKKASRTFKAYSKQLSFDIMRPHLDESEKLKIAGAALDEVYLTLNFKKSFNTREKLKPEVIRSIKSVLDIEGGKQILWNYRYDTQVAIVVEILIISKKVAFLIETIEEISPKPEQGEKINWLGTPSELGLLINELEKAGYIQKSAHSRGSARDSWRRTAQLIFNTFHVPDQARVGETSLENLYKEIKSPSLSNTAAGFFKIVRKNRK